MTNSNLPSEPQLFIKKNITHKDASIAKGLYDAKRLGEEAFRQKIIDVFNSYNPPISNRHHLHASNWFSYSSEVRGLVRSVLSPARSVFFHNIQEYMRFLREHPETEKKPLFVYLHNQYDTNPSMGWFDKLSSEDQSLFVNQPGVPLIMEGLLQIAQLSDKKLANIQALSLSTLQESIRQQRIVNGFRNLILGDSEAVSHLNDSVPQRDNTELLNLLQEQLLKHPLVHLSITVGAELSLDFVVKFLEEAGDTLQLECLRLEALPVITPQLIEAITKNKSLRKISLMTQNMNVRAEGVDDKLIRGLLSLPSLEYITLQGFDFTELSPDIIHSVNKGLSLDLVDTQFNQPFINALLTSKKLYGVDLSGFRPSDIRFDAVKNNSLQEISLFNENESNTSVEGLVKNLATHNSLRNLDIYNIPEISNELVAALNQLEGVESLTLSWSDEIIHDEEMVEINSRYLEKLSLPSSLNSFKMENLPVNAEVLQVLQNLESLQVLELSNIQNPQYSLSQLLLCFQRLTRLALSDSKLHPGIFKAIAQLPHLKFLSLRGNRTLTADHLRNLVNCKSLQFIDLSSCDHLTQEIVPILTQIPSLLEVHISSFNFPQMCFSPQELMSLLEQNRGHR